MENGGFTEDSKRKMAQNVLALWQQNDSARPAGHYIMYLEGEPVKPPLGFEGKEFNTNRGQE